MAPLTRREQKEQTRQLILEVAAREFARKGLLGAKTAEIAEAAGISHGSIFAHFVTREALVAAVINEVGGRIASRVRSLVLRGGDVRVTLSAHLEALSEHEDFYARLVLEGPLLPSDARRVFVEIQSAICSHLEEALEADLARKKVRKLPLDFVFNTWLGLLHHYLLNRDLFAPEGSVLKRHGTKLMDQYLELLAPERKQT